jgi:hypothetical protein
MACLLAGATAHGAQPALSPAQAQALVDRALANELRAAQDSTHPMRYTLHKVSVHFTKSQQIVETRDGDVARLTAIWDKPLSAEAEQQEEARLATLAQNPGMQRHRKNQEDADTARALKVLRELPSAFTYQYAGPVDTPSGPAQKFTFKPSPGYSPPSLETQILTQMSGSIVINMAKERVIRLEGHLDEDVDFGWGILGRLNKGGWIVIEQADVGGNQWRAVHFQMAMSGRVLFKTRVFDTTEDQSEFTPVPLRMSYVEGIKMLETDLPTQPTAK